VTTRFTPQEATRELVRQVAVDPDRRYDLWIEQFRLTVAEPAEPRRPSSTSAS
jgi:hypothetical protein